MRMSACLCLEVVLCFTLFAPSTSSEVGVAAEAGLATGLALRGAAASTDEARALDVKNSEFWLPLEEAAVEDLGQVEKHKALLQEAETELEMLPSENSYVREALADAVEGLRHADEDLAAQASQSADVAEEHLAFSHQDTILDEDHGSVSGPFSWLVGDGSIVSRLVQFLTGMKFASQAREEMEERQEAILPSLRGALRGASRSSAGVLHESHVAASRSFDIIRYDIYNSSAPKTPKAVVAVANKIADASADSRHRYMQLTLRSVSGVKHDAETADDDAQATVARSLGSQGFLAKKPAEEETLGEAESYSGISPLSELFLIVGAVSAGILLGASGWGTVPRQSVSITPNSISQASIIPAEWRSAAIAIGLFLFIAVGAFMFDSMGLLDRTAFGGVICLGLGALFLRSVARRLAPYVAAKHKLKTLEE